jgi:hypothetical protein
MKRLTLVFLAAFGIGFFGGCATPMVTKADKFPLMYSERPTTIFVMPPINNTTAADAKEYYSTTIAEPLALSGFYVIPMEITGELLKAQGIYDTEMIGDQPLGRFHEYFGADAVLFTQIQKWDKSYMVLASNLTVTVDAKLKSTITDKVLWEYSGTIVADLSGSNSSSGNPLADLIAKAIVTAVTTATADYVPYARLANQRLLLSVPFGKYHIRGGQDGQEKIVDLTPRKTNL